jgi:peptide/nickel transport system substrate-binding protein
MAMPPRMRFPFDFRRPRWGGRLAPRLAVAAALAWLPAACATPATPPPPGSGTPQAEATTDPNMLVWALAAAPLSLDPARMTVDPGGVQVAAQVYDRLFRFRQDGSFGLAPGVAEDWDIDLGGKTYTFTIREGVRFHDGTPLDAPAVKWNLDRWMDPRHEGHDGDFLAWQSFFGGFVGEVDEGSGRALNLVERVQALDRRTLRITLREPFAPFPYHLATMPFSLASPAAIRDQGADYGSDAEHLPVGSGPFRISS